VAEPATLTWLQIATSSAAGAIFGSLLNGFWTRRSAKKQPKTQMRAEAYRDFVVYVARALHPRQQTASESDSDVDFGDIKARLLLFGESNVVKAASEFLTTHRAVTSEVSRKAFALVVREMRASLLTGHHGAVVQSVSALLAAEPLQRELPPAPSDAIVTTPA
jgi:hypothetical protein